MEFIQNLQKERKLWQISFNSEKKTFMELKWIPFKN